MPWTGLGITVLVLGVLAFAWATARGDEPAFPEPILNGVGLLLTALVFVLALAQGRLTRTADTLVAEAGRLEDVFVAAYVADSGAVVTPDLWMRASEMKGALFEDTAADWSRHERQLVLRRARERPGNWGAPGIIDMLAGIASIDRELARRDGEPDAPSQRRRAYLVREKKRLERDYVEAIQADERAGTSVYGYRRLRARFEVAQLAVRQLVSMARAFSMLMMALVVLGAIYAGWGAGQGPSVHLWTAIVLIALALVYTRVVTRDIDLEVAATDSALRELTLITLHDAEGGLGTLCNELDAPESDSDSVRDRQKWVERLTARASQRMPDLHWLSSLRGRIHLLRATHVLPTLRTATRIDIGAERWRSELLIDLRPAARLLALAAGRGDDPIAALAYASLLRLEAEIIDAGVLPRTPAFFDSDNATMLRARARAHVNRAIDLNADQPTLPSSVFALPHHLWLTDQTYLWPTDPDQRRALAEQLPLTADGGLP